MRKAMFKKEAFTLIELLVVIAIIALLLAILTPSLSLVKKKGQGVVCLKNQGSIGLAWFMYQGDNDGKLVSSYVYKDGWVKMPQDEAGNITWSIANPACPLEDKIRGIERGLLYPYLDAHAVYHCPGDRRKNYNMEGYRSYSLVSCLNGYAEGNKNYNLQHTKYSSIKNPSSKYMLVEESDSRGFNSTYWILAAKEFGYDPPCWWSILSINHGDSSTLGFCDGHAEQHKWVENLTKELAKKILKPGEYYGITPVPAGQTRDIDYMYRGWPYR